MEISDENGDADVDDEMKDSDVRWRESGRGLKRRDEATVWS